MRKIFLFTFIMFHYTAGAQLLKIKSGDTTYLKQLPPVEDAYAPFYDYVTKDSVFNGQFVVYDPADTNKLFIEGTYRNGLKTGIWKYHFVTGQLQSIVEYTNNIENGLSISFEQDGTISCYGQMKDGEGDGEWKIFENNILSYTGIEKNGKREGLWKLFDENGNLKETHSCHENILEGEFRAFYPSGKIMTTGAYHNRVKIGKWTYYYENGKKKWEEDTATGKITHWNENGNEVKK